MEAGVSNLVSGETSLCCHHDLQQQVADGSNPHSRGELTFQRESRGSGAVGAILEVPVTVNSRTKD